MIHNTTISPLGRYYTHLRDDVVKLVPTTARNILSVGCGAGVTEAKLLSEGRRVVGIESNPDVAGMARSKGLEVLCGDAETMELDPHIPYFDCIIYADILEHLRCPELVLRRHVTHLSRGGCVIVSVPNFRHLSSLVALALGTWRYRPSGIFDRTHLRITTRAIVTDWLHSAGLVVDACLPIFHGRSWRWPAAIALGILDGVLAQQLLFRASKREENG